MQKKFSVIIPIYNVEDYIEETIKSIINQTIGFEDNIEIILINDGSPDNSEEICLKYKKEYPNNIKYLKKENEGVSVARNKGIELAKGEFTIFLDSDDKLSSNTFEEVYKKHQENPDIKIFSFRMNFFDAKKGQHPLNYKYTEDKVINILENYEYPQLSSSSTIIKTDLLKNYKYDKNIKYSEDNKFINEILFDEQKMMVLNKPIYYYRKRKNRSSAVQGSTRSIDWYLVTPKKVYSYLFALSKKKFGKVIKYIQYLVAYEMSWRISFDDNGTLNKKELKEYQQELDKLIEDIDSDIIINHPNLSDIQKLFLLRKKKDGKAIKDFKSTSRKLELFKIDQIYQRGDMLDFYCHIDTKELDNKMFKVSLNGEEIEKKYYDLAFNFDGSTYDGEGFYRFKGLNFKIPIKEGQKISFIYDNEQLPLSFNVIAFLTERLPKSYHHLNKKLTIRCTKNEIIIQKRNLFKSIHYEIANELSLIKRKNFKLVLARFSNKVIRLFKRKQIWIISDRLDVAGDNGEHFFKYMIKNHKEVNSYFVLSPNSKDYEKMKKIGKVLDPNSNKYKLLFHASDYVVSSQANGFTYNPLGTNGYYICDQYYFKYVFLQHGIIKDDLSPWLNANCKRMDMFVTSTNKEYESVLGEKYYFGPRVVKLTGLPRYDTLLKKEQEPKEKSIMVSFTWRSNLASLSNPLTGEKIYNPNFKESNYFKEINDFLNDKKINEILEKYDYNIRFCPHPNVWCQIEDFDEGDRVTLLKDDIDYQEEFRKNKLLITDCSSVFFDFGYLNKPIIYYQFDMEDFYEKQIYDKGYFNYERDGFGPVCSDKETLIKLLEEYLKKDCKIEDKYSKIIKKTFKYNDNNNCERVYDEIIKL